MIDAKRFAREVVIGRQPLLLPQTLPRQVFKRLVAPRYSVRYQPANFGVHEKAHAALGDSFIILSVIFWGNVELGTFH